MNLLKLPPLKLISLAFLSWCIGPSVSVQVYGIELMDSEDLARIPVTSEVGNLDFGDPCRNKGIRDITDDVCFHSNPTFQCVDGRCRCIFVRISKTKPEKTEQMVYQNGKCRRPANWTCKSSENCASGLTCESAPKEKKSSDNENSEPRSTDYDSSDTENEPKLNIYRKKIKESIKTMFQRKNESIETNTTSNDVHNFTDREDFIGRAVKDVDKNTNVEGSDPTNEDSGDKNTRSEPNINTNTNGKHEDPPGPSQNIKAELSSLKYCQKAGSPKYFPRMILNSIPLLVVIRYAKMYQST